MCDVRAPVHETDCFRNSQKHERTTLKKQISPRIQAHLRRSALILLSLVSFNQDIFCQTPTPTATATPSPTASVCARPTPGTCVSYEAESDDNTLTGSAFVLSCPTCSGGFKVGYVGNNSGTLQFNAVGIVVPGRHTVTISYTNGDPVRYALLSVNGNQGMPLTFPSTGSFQTVGSIQTTVVLNTGCNTLEFHNPIVGSWTPDFDQIQFNCPTCQRRILGNISTRSFVQMGDNVMIGGFIVQGTQSKRVILRGIGPELSQYGIPNAMADPTLELHNANGALIAFNDDWSTQQSSPGHSEQRPCSARPAGICDYRRSATGSLHRDCAWGKQHDGSRSCGSV